MRFAIRDLLWLMVVVALGLGWFTDRRTLIDLLQRKSQQAESADMKTYALERILDRDGYSVYWGTDGRRVVVKTPRDASYDYPTDERRPPQEF